MIRLGQRFKFEGKLKGSALHQDRIFAVWWSLARTACWRTCSRQATSEQLDSKFELRSPESSRLLWNFHQSHFQPNFSIAKGGWISSFLLMTPKKRSTLSSFGLDLGVGHASHSCRLIWTSRSTTIVEKKVERAIKGSYEVIKLHSTADEEVTLREESDPQWEKTELKSRLQRLKLRWEAWVFPKVISLEVLVPFR